MNIVILGGSGYLGAALAKYLSNIHKISLCTRNPLNVKKLKNICNIIEVRHYSKKFLKKVFSNQNIIINCIGLSNNELKKNPKKKNIRAKILSNIISVCRDKNIRIIHFSSIQVYENYEFKKIITEKSPVKGRSHYSKSHLECEKILIKNKNNLQLTIIRLASVFGINYYQNYGEQKNTLINSLCSCAILKKKIIIINKNIIRNFIPIKIFLMFVKKTIYFNKKLMIINLGYQTYSLLQISKIISKYYKNILKKKLDIVFLDHQKITKKKFKYLSVFFKINVKKKIFENEIKNTLKIYLKNYEN